MNDHTCQQFFRKTPGKLLLLSVYFISVNLLSGYSAVWLDFPSLWGNSQVFLEYAMPIGMTWAMAHWPSFVLVSIPLILLPNWNVSQIRRFRIICLCLFLVLLYGIIEKIPFALFPAVDLLTAFFFSLVIAPPNYNENPVLTIALALLLLIVILSGIYYSYSKWQHRIPVIKETSLMNGLFVLKNIEVDNGYRKELLFTIELTQYIDQETVCDTATEMSKLVFKTYPFDKNYKKIIDIIFNPKQKDNELSAYPLGLIEQYKEDNKLQIGCYLKYK